MRQRTVISHLAALTFAAGSAIATGATAAHAEDPAASQDLAVTEFVGAVPGTEAYLSLAVASDGRAVAYLCDSTGLSEWLTGTVEGTAVTLEANETIPGTDTAAVGFSGDIGGDEAVGTVKWFFGSGVDVELAVATGTAGLYRGTGEVNGVTVTAGWFETQDGVQGGMITGGGLRQPAESIDTAAIQDGTSNVTTTFIQGDVHLVVESETDLFVLPRTPS